MIVEEVFVTRVVLRVMIPLLAVAWHIDIGLPVWAAQGSTEPQEFEAAIIKRFSSPRPSVPSRCIGGPGTTDPTLFRCDNFRLSHMIMLAHDLKAFQVSGPGWMDMERYTLTARVPPDTSLLQFRLMLQRLLLQSFKLRVHFKDVETKVYELSVAQGGLKLAKSEGEHTLPEGPVFTPPLSPPARTSVTRRGTNEPIATLAGFLSNQLGRPVVDVTGLFGKYNYQLTWISEPAVIGTVAMPSPSSGQRDDEHGLTLVDAVRQQLGLVLELRPGRTRVLVVDYAEKLPSEK